MTLVPLEHSNTGRGNFFAEVKGPTFEKAVVARKATDEGQEALFAGHAEV
jgi:hypothetical protein